MGKALLATVVVGLLCSVALAFDPMGKPAAGLSKGQFSFGAEWSYSDMDVLRQAAWEGGQMAEMNLELHKVYANIGYGITDNWDLFVRLGGARMEYERAFSGNEWEGDDIGWPAAGVGAKATFWQNADSTVMLGGLAQFSWVTFNGHDDSVYGYEGQFTSEFIEWQLAVGPTLMPSDDVAVYGGLMLHTVDGWFSKGKTRGVIEDSDAGFFVGGQIDLSGSCSLSAEWMSTSDADGFAVAIMWAQ